MKKAALQKKIAGGTFLFVLMFGPIVVSAQSADQYFGGEQTLVYDESMCDCSDSNVHFIEDDTTNTELKLEDDGSATIYSNNDIDNVGGNQIGSYTPGGDTCTEIVGDDCVDLSDVDGIYDSVGTSSTAAMLDTTSEFVANSFAPFVGGFFGTDGKA